MAIVLIVDDETTFARNSARFLERAGHRATVAGTLGEARSLLAEQPPDIVVLDYRLPDGTGLDLIQHIRASDADMPIVLITGHGSIELAVEAMKAGANDLLTKPVGLPELRGRVEALARQQRSASRLQYFEARERDNVHDLLGDSPAMQALRDRIERIASIDSEGMRPPILITGETGTGKELVARACHYRSPRRAAPFVEINCAAMPAQLLEAELFGYERGAFTDAKQRKLGLLEAADGGTLFLDEIGDMDLAQQAKLLKVIEDGRFRRVGGVQEQQVALRIVAATHQDLQARVTQGAFRADLYFRLRVLQLQVPPLRDRGGDVLLLARHFCASFAARYRRPQLQLGASAQAALARHVWPGNVRELRNLLEQAVMLAPGGQIEASDLLLPEAEPSASGAGSVLERLEREQLVAAMAAAGQNVSMAARQLGISRDTLRYRLDKHGLKG